MIRRPRGHTLRRGRKASRGSDALAPAVVPTGGPRGPDRRWPQTRCRIWRPVPRFSVGGRGTLLRRKTPITSGRFGLPTLLDPRDASPATTGSALDIRVARPDSRYRFAFCARRRMSSRALPSPFMSSSDPGRDGCVAWPASERTRSGHRGFRQAPLPPASGADALPAASRDNTATIIASIGNICLRSEESRPVVARRSAPRCGHVARAKISPRTSLPWLRSVPGSRATGRGGRHRRAGPAGRPGYRFPGLALRLLLETSRIAGSRASRPGAPHSLTHQLARHRLRPPCAPGYRSSMQSPGDALNTPCSDRCDEGLRRNVREVVDHEFEFDATN